ncbi:magnesium/cobalt transporter CorA [Paenibacillus validus]|uniref:Magnesium transport protein CorA n=1 Tax=Paenibacillus validus TaxID=44253 RepID=A0A7X3CPZ8_9BACL|nr:MULTISPECIES: magnesium/cobalt transporter CorA [Paenibacillus]MED4603095.1 magnesium/cobalt transporter CorA [Paenibacillus validus]MED4608716.1 magnesium/cobalt transporter CorA [Paenibacillus validus]MUG69115.1 magnesium/cobalt transporter CorA [Paenibacillus validus]
MIRSLAVTYDLQVMEDVSLNRLADADIRWYWVDFNDPTEEEAKLLESHFHFHPLAVEDCFHLLQRPKLDHYEDVHFFVMHAIHPQTLAAEEVDLFLGNNFVVTFHLNPAREVEDAWAKISGQNKGVDQGPIYAAYLIMDKLVDQYFPSVYQIEDQLNDIENKVRSESIQALMDDIFEIRSKLLKLRRTIVPMRDLLYRVINSERIEGIKEHLFYFKDVHDHLLKLSEMIDSNRDVTADMRDSYISLNSNRMNTIMKTLTVITTIFMPLTFIAGIYGMNFENMPELKWQWGYFIVLALMFAIGFGMFTWFRKKGWFN